MAGSSHSRVTWNRKLLRQLLQKLARINLGPTAAWASDAGLTRALDEIVELGMQPEIRSALMGRIDPPEAVRDVAVRFAFSQIMTHGVPSERIDQLSQALFRQQVDRIQVQAEAQERQFGENPFDLQPELQMKIYRDIAAYVPKKPMGAHIKWKLRHYESHVERAMRQIENLVRTAAVTDSFVAFVMTSDLDLDVQSHLCNMARGGGRSQVDAQTAIRFFAEPGTVAFVKRFASTVQPARTLYGEDEYLDVEWCGRRRLPRERRQGYLDAAYGQLARLHDVSLDEEMSDRPSHHERSAS